MISKQPALDATQAERLLQMVLGIVDAYLQTGGDERVFEPVTLLNASRLMLVPEYAQSPRTLAVLGMLLWVRQLKSGSTADLDAALRFFSHVYPIEPRALPYELYARFAEEPPAAQPVWQAWHSLGNALAEEWRRDGGERLLDHAIMMFGMSLAAAPPAVAYRPGMEYNLGVSLCARFQLLRERDDLEAGVAALQRAAQIVSDGDSNRELIWMALGDAFATRFLSTRALTDVDGALAAYRVAGPAARFALGSALWSRFELTQHPETLDEAIEVFQVEIAQATPSDRPAALSALSHALMARYRIHHDPADLDTALTSAGMALAETPADDGQRGIRAHNLAVLREMRARAGEA